MSNVAGLKSAEEVKQVTGVQSVPEMTAEEEVVSSAMSVTPVDNGKNLWTFKMLCNRLNETH